MPAKKIFDIFILFILLILAIWLSPFILIGIFVYFFYLIRRNIITKKLFEEVKREWFPKGKHVFFLYSNSEKWKDYFENELIPKILKKSVVWNWSTRQKDGWNDDILDARILRYFRPVGHFYPMAIVFLPSGEVKIFQFYSSYVQMLKSQKDDYKKLEKEFLGAVATI